MLKCTCWQWQVVGVTVFRLDATKNTDPETEKQLLCHQTRVPITGLFVGRFSPKA